MSCIPSSSVRYVLQLQRSLKTKSECYIIMPNAGHPITGGQSVGILCGANRAEQHALSGHNCMHRWISLPRTKFEIACCVNHHQTLSQLSCHNRGPRLQALRTKALRILCCTVLNTRLQAGAWGLGHSYDALAVDDKIYRTHS